jgi:Zn-dependent protease with chaperone function
MLAGMSSETVTVTCPECEQVVVENEGYRTWCPQCNWNLAADFGRPRRSFVRRRLDRTSDRLVVSLYEDLRAGGASKPGWDAARVASYVLAAGVHLLTVALVVVAVTVSVLSPTFPAFVLSLLLLAVAFFVRPRFGRVPRDGVVLTRTGAPELYRLLDRVAEETGARRVDLVVADPRFNAGYGAIGLRRRRIVRIGLPLWNALTPEERVSVLGHEMGHAVNGDSRHLLIVGTALGSLERLYFLLQRGKGWEERYAGSFVALLALVIRFAKWLLRLPVAGTYLALSMLTLRAGQRAEYLADRLAAATASPAAAGDALDKIRTVEETLLPAISYQAAYPTRVHLWSKQRELIARIPAQELERRRRISAVAEHRVDTSHPPTHLRVALLRDLPDAEPKVSLAVKEVEAIEQELASAYEKIAVALAAPYRAAHYEN